LKRGYCGVGIYNYQHECNVGTLFRTAFAFGADFVFTVGRKYSRRASDTPNSTYYTPCFNYLNSADLLDGLPLGARLVCAEIDEKAWGLPNFVHPDRAVYLLGRETGGIPKGLLAKALVVSIPGRVCLNVATAGGILLYDRIAKHGRLDSPRAAQSFLLQRSAQTPHEPDLAGQAGREAENLRV